MTKLWKGQIKEEKKRKELHEKHNELQVKMRMSKKNKRFLHM